MRYNHPGDLLLVYKTPKKLNKELKVQVSDPVVALQNGTGTTMMPKELLPETKEKKIYQP